MKALLDTHALLWWWTDDPLLSATARSFIQNQDNTILVSAASAWEIATKHRLGKLESAAEAVSRFHELATLDAFEHLPVTSLHALRAGTLEVDHRDPFDRMLAAQCELEGVPLITCDAAFAGFRVRTMW